MYEISDESNNLTPRSKEEMASQKEADIVADSVSSYAKKLNNYMVLIYDYIAEQNIKEFNSTVESTRACANGLTEQLKKSNMSDNVCIQIFFILDN